MSNEDPNVTDWSEAGSATVGDGSGNQTPIDANAPRSQDPVKEIIQGFKDIFSPFSPNRKAYTTITPPIQDPYLQNPDALKSRRQAGTTPFQELFVNCHEFTNSAGTLPINAVQMDQVAVATAFQISLVIGGVSCKGDTVANQDIVRNLSIQTVNIGIGSLVAGAGITVGSRVLQVGSQNNYAINYKMQVYLSNMFGPNTNEAIAGGVAQTPPVLNFSAWVTVEIPISGSFLKIDLMPAQYTLPPIVFASLDNPNGQIQNNSDILTTSPRPAQDYNQQSNRNIFIQFDANDANIIIAKPGRTFRTDGFESIFLTFQTDNGRIRCTAGYGQAELADSDTSKLARQNLHMWPGEEILNDPVLHPIPFSISAGHLSQNTDINNTPYNIAEFIKFPSVWPPNIGNWVTQPLIDNRTLIKNSPTNFGVVGVNAFDTAQNGVAVGWITRITFVDYDNITALAHFKVAIGVGDPYDPGYQSGPFSLGAKYFARTLWQRDFSLFYSGWTTLNNVEYTFPTPLRFTLLGGKKNNQFIDLASNQVSSFGDCLFVAFRNNGGISLNVIVEGYMMGTLQSTANQPVANFVGDFSNGSAVVQNITRSFRGPYISPNIMIVANNGNFVSPTIADSNAAPPYNMTMSVVSNFTGVQVPFQAYITDQYCMKPQTFNVHPFPGDRMALFDGNGVNAQGTSTLGRTP